jgi:hypothetical protein
LREGDLGGGGGDGEESDDGEKPYRSMSVVDMYLITESPVRRVFYDELCASAMGCSYDVCHASHYPVGASCLACVTGRERWEALDVLAAGADYGWSTVAGGR